MAEIVMSENKAILMSSLFIGILSAAIEGGISQSSFRWFFATLIFSLPICIVGSFLVMKPFLILTRHATKKLSSLARLPFFFLVPALVVFFIVILMLSNSAYEHMNHDGCAVIVNGALQWEDVPCILRYVGFLPIYGGLGGVLVWLLIEKKEK